MKDSFQLLRLIWLSLILAISCALLILFLASLLLYHLHTSDTVHCYWLSPPLNHTETAILTGHTTDCVVDHCRLVFNTQLQRGLVCFYPRPFQHSQSSSYTDTEFSFADW